MNKKEAIQMFAGTVARGIMWAFGLLAAKFGTDKLDKDAALALGSWVVGTAFIIIAGWWSKRKDKKLLDKEPPEK